MKRIALIATIALLCMCMTGCASNSAESNQSESAAAASSSSNAGSSSASASSDTVSVGEEIDVAGSIIMVTSSSFVVDCSGVHFTCIPADSKSVNYVTAGNFVEVEGVVTSIQDDSSVTLEDVTIDDYSDGYKDIGEHFEHHSERHHD